MESQEQISVIASDLHCGRCSYNLRTLRMDGNCPECGVPVARTFRGDVWSAADARWRTDVVIGIAAIALAMIVWVATQVLFGQGYKIENLLGVSANIVAGFLLLGVIVMTRAEPDALKEEKPWSRRRILRWGAINVIALFASSRFWGAQEAIFAQGRYFAKTLILINIVAVFPLLWIFAMMVARFCGRAAKKTLARIWLFTGWAGLVAGVFLILPTGYWFAFKRSGLSDELANMVILLPTVAVAVFLAGLLTGTTFALWIPSKK